MVIRGFEAYVMAMDRVRDRLLKVTSALDAAGVLYAVIGGNAVAAWISRVDPAATRTTKDVDVLIRRSDVDQVTAALSALGFQRETLRDLVMFTDPEEPSRRSGVHLIWAQERVRPSYSVVSPSVDEAVRDPFSGFLVLDLPALVRMKLTSFRDLDRVHIADLLEVGLIDARVRNSLPADLAERLAQIERDHDPHLS
jgi:hypothetical protein